jgi:predicted secreted protein
MAITLGPSGTSTPVVTNTNVISATYTESCDTIDISNRGNVGDGYKATAAGFITKSWSIECHDSAALMATVAGNLGTTGMQATSVSENASIDGAVTYTVELNSFG